MIEYSIIARLNIISVEIDVDKKTQEGWEPVGAAVIKQTYVYQTLIRKSNFLTRWFCKRVKTKVRPNFRDTANICMWKHNKD